MLRVNAGVSVPVSGEPLHVKAVFEKGDAREFGLNVLGYELSYNSLLGEFSTIQGEKSIKTNYVNPGSEEFIIEAIVDKNILEVFVNGGELYYAMPFNGDKSKVVEVFIKGRGNSSKALLKKLEVHELNSIWKE